MNNDDQFIVLKGKKIGPLLGMFLYVFLVFFMVLKGHFEYSLVSGTGKWARNWK